MTKICDCSWKRRNKNGVFFNPPPFRPTSNLLNLHEVPNQRTNLTLICVFFLISSVYDLWFVFQRWWILTVRCSNKSLFCSSPKAIKKLLIRINLEQTQNLNHGYTKFFLCIFSLFCLEIRNLRWFYMKKVLLFHLDTWSFL